MAKGEAPRTSISERAAGSIRRILKTKARLFIGNFSHIDDQAWLARLHGDSLARFLRTNLENVREILRATEARDPNRLRLKVALPMLDRLKLLAPGASHHLAATVFDRMEREIEALKATAGGLEIFVEAVAAPPPFKPLLFLRHAPPAELRTRFADQPNWVDCIIKARPFSTALEFMEKARNNPRGWGPALRVRQAADILTALEIAVPKLPERTPMLETAPPVAAPLKLALNAAMGLVLTHGMFTKGAYASSTQGTFTRGAYALRMGLSPSETDPFLERLKADGWVEEITSKRARETNGERVFVATEKGERYGRIVVRK